VSNRLLRRPLNRVFAAGGRSDRGRLAGDAGSLEFGDAVIDRVHEVASQVLTVVDVFLDRPAILTPIVDRAAAVVANYGAHPSALLDVLFGLAEPRGRLPFDLPSSMEAVAAPRHFVGFGQALRVNP